MAYICSRYYRAPELIFGATQYATSIGALWCCVLLPPCTPVSLLPGLADVWSSGCMLGELMLGRPLFAGDTGLDQLVEIIKVLGTPSEEQMNAMNPSYTEMSFPQVAPQPWGRVFRSRAYVTEDAVDLLDKMLKVCRPPCPEFCVF